MENFTTISALKGSLDQHRPLVPIIVANLREDMTVCCYWRARGIQAPETDPS